MSDLSEPGDLDAWRNGPPVGDVDAARRRLYRRNVILDWFQIGFLVIIPVLSAVTLIVARHADHRASSAREDTHALTGDVSALSDSVDRLTKSQQDNARLEADVADMAEAFRRIATATTPAERQEAIDALAAIPPPPSSSTTTTTSPPAAASSSRTSPASTTPTTTPPTTIPSSTSSTSTTRRLLPALTLPTLPTSPASSSSSSSSSSSPWSLLSVGVGLAFLLAFPAALVTAHERKPMTQPMTDTVKAAPNAAGRIIRTLYMVVIAVAVAIPAATAAFGFSAATAAKLVGLAGGITILVTAVWNALEGAGVIGTVAAAPAPAPPAARLAAADVDLIAATVRVNAAAAVTAGTVAVEVPALSDEEVEKIAAGVARHVVMAAVAPSTTASKAGAAKKATPARKAPAKKAAPRRR